ncbi:hypothetical protein BOTBODRAFT_119238 [Botryobasidium botryosum FD-172 SS1]|uniref:Protein kinase domain-containing protein n=1 Tax=Botryobasidium botryosum (strain FD-172 SS1) TaxID=930990 RepID=A0A067M020_BOTB1|nr:hypothetical protein BOTBODRAFT_119238 [Botryobasidium botryosum FD-172 SS1]
MEEIRILGSLDHPRIIALHDSYYIPMDHTVYFTLELAGGGSIQSLIDSRRRALLKEKHVARILTEVLQGFEYIHSRGVIHRDIKPANILLTTDGHVKIGKSTPSPIFECPLLTHHCPLATRSRLWPRMHPCQSDLEGYG